MYFVYIYDALKVIHQQHLYRRSDILVELSVILFYFLMQELTSVFRKTYSERGFLNLLFKQILLVKEKDDGGIRKPFVITDRIK